MRIVIIGGSQGTGAELAQQALAAGHEVTVLSRSGAGPDGARRVKGDASHPAVVTEAIDGADAVVVTVGGAKGVKHPRTQVTRAVIEAMQGAGVRRLLVQSSLGAGDSAQQMPQLLRTLMKVALAKPLADHDAQEAAVVRSGLDWTILRPTGLSGKPGTGTWQARRVSDGGYLKGQVTRADLASCMLEVLQDETTVSAALGVSSV